MSEPNAPPCVRFSKPASDTTPLLAAEPLSERREVIDSTKDESHGQDGWNFEPGDPSNPLDWSPAFKRGIVALLAGTGFMV
jgi:hypothetical protein